MEKSNTHPTKVGEFDGEYTLHITGSSISIRPGMDEDTEVFNSNPPNPDAFDEFLYGKLDEYRKPNVLHTVNMLSLMHGALVSMFNLPADAKSIEISANDAMHFMHGFGRFVQDVINVKTQANKSVENAMHKNPMKALATLLAGGDMSTIADMAELRNELDEDCDGCDAYDDCELPWKDPNIKGATTGGLEDHSDLIAATQREILAEESKSVPVEGKPIK